MCAHTLHRCRGPTSSSECSFPSTQRSHNTTRSCCTIQLAPVAPWASLPWLAVRGAMLSKVVLPYLGENTTALRTCQWLFVYNSDVFLHRRKSHQGYFTSVKR